MPLQRVGLGWARWSQSRLSTRDCQVRLGLAPYRSGRICGMDQQVQDRLARLFADVRTVLTQHGVTDAGLEAAGRLLAAVAAEPWVQQVELAPKHGGASES